MRRDRAGELFQTDFTDDNSMPDGPESEDVAETLKPDPDIGPQGGDDS
jgi:hypothetical protein